ncbi:ROK family protein [Candidatus Auribacterota bacterium]
MTAEGSNKIFVGVDVGGTKILSCPLRLDDQFKVLGEEKKRTKAHKGVTGVIDRIIETVYASLEKSSITINDVAAVGAGVPGAVDAEKGEVIFAPNIGWKKINLKKVLENEFKVPCFVDNDVNMGTFGEEKFGAGAGCRNVVGIFWGTGIGGGIIFDGKIHRGLNFTAGEIGHMILEVGGPKCGCGNKGCLEALCSRTAISKTIFNKIKKGKSTRIKLTDEDHDTQLIKSGALKEALLSDDKLVTGVLIAAAKDLGAGIASIINLLCPEMVIVGGGVIESMGPELMPVIKESAKANSFPFAQKGVKVVQAKLGDYAVLAGAAQFAKEGLLKNEAEAAQLQGKN